MSTADAAAALLAPCVVVTLPIPMVFVYVPTVDDVTFTVTVQVAPAPTAPPLRLSVVPANDTVPGEQVVAAFGAAAKVTFAGSVSESDRPLSATLPVAVLATVMVSADVAPVTMAAGVNVLLNVTLGAATVSVAVASAPLVAPCVLVSVPAVIVFV